MKKLLYIFIFILFVTSGLTAGDKNKELKWKKYDAGLAEAKKLKKKILVDVYTDWCKWCKKLDAEVYTDAKVAKYLDQQYIPVKINAESDEKVKFEDMKITEAELAAKLGVSGYPTIIFLDTEGKYINKLASFVPAERFLPIVQYIGDDNYKKMSWEEFQKKIGLTVK